MTKLIDQGLNVTEERGKAPFRQIVAVTQAIAGLGFVGGGAARRLQLMYSAPKPSDIDVFCYREESHAEIVRVLKSLGYVRMLDAGQAEAYRAPSAGSLPVQVVPACNVNPLQKRFGSIEDVLADFTFVCEMFAVYALIDRFADNAPPSFRKVYTREAVNDTLAKRIRFNTIVNPIYATWRIGKYSRKGFRIAMGESQKLYRAWDAIPDTRRAAMLEASGEPGNMYREMGRL